MDLSTVNKVSGIRAISPASFPTVTALFRVTPAARACVCDAHTLHAPAVRSSFIHGMSSEDRLSTRLHARACPSLPELACTGPSNSATTRRRWSCFGCDVSS